MLNRLIEFIKYNNAFILILAVILIMGTGVFASEPGREAVGKKLTSIEGIDNTLLVEADLDGFDMDFQISKIEQDEEYHYITYTYLDLIFKNNVWQYEMQEKIRKVSKKNTQDIGIYMAEELSEEYEARLRDLRTEQAVAREQGKSKRTEVIEFSGLLGKTLDVAGKIFDGYQPVARTEIPSPNLPTELLDTQAIAGDTAVKSDNMSKVYEEYVTKNDPDSDNIFGLNDNCPLTANPDQADSDGDGTGDSCDSDITGQTGTETLAPEPVTTTETPSAPSVETAAPSAADAPVDDSSAPLAEDTVQVVEPETAN